MWDDDLYLVAAKDFIKGNQSNHNSPSRVQIIQEHFQKVTTTTNIPEIFPKVSKIIPFPHLIFDQPQRKLSATLAHCICLHIFVCVCVCLNPVTFIIVCKFSTKFCFPWPFILLNLPVFFLLIFQVFFGKKIDKYPSRHFCSNKL